MRRHAAQVALSAAVTAHYYRLQRYTVAVPRQSQAALACVPLLCVACVYSVCVFLFNLPNRASAKGLQLQAHVLL